MTPTGWAANGIVAIGELGHKSLMFAESRRNLWDELASNQRDLDARVDSYDESAMAVVAIQRRVSNNTAERVDKIKCYGVLIETEPMEAEASDMPEPENEE